MKRYKYDQLRRAQEKKLYYKMYKAGKNWIIAGLTMVGFSFMFSIAAEMLAVQPEKRAPKNGNFSCRNAATELMAACTPLASIFMGAMAMEATVLKIVLKIAGRSCPRWPLLPGRSTFSAS